MGGNPTYLVTKRVISGVFCVKVEKHTGREKTVGFPYIYYRCSSSGRVQHLQYFGHLMRRVDSLEKTLMLEGVGAGGEGDDRGGDGWMASLTQWT